MPAPYTGREYGKSFEQIFEKIGRLNGLVVLKNHLAGVPIGGGGVRIIKSELDYRIIKRALYRAEDVGSAARAVMIPAQVAFVDCKTFAGSHFCYSDLLAKKEPQDHQIQRALLYNDCGLPSGFVVWFRKTDEVVFYTGRMVHEAGPGSRFEAKDGQSLGRLTSFDLRLIFV